MLGILVNFLVRLFAGRLIGGLVAILVGALVGAWFSRLDGELRQEIRPADVLRWTWTNFCLGLVFGLVYWLVLGLILWLDFAAGMGLVLWLFYGLGSALGSGLVGGLSGTQGTEDMRIKPNQGIQGSGWNALRIGFIFILVFALVGGLFSVLILGLAFGLVYGGVAYLDHYILRFLLWRSGAMPLHYIRFLEEARERILLQRVGGGYRFIHPLFLEYFASQATTAAHGVVQQSSSPHP